ncbi:hypothetical protein I3843_08G140600 [Carya illinoinensis]|nr:hypothetical protein I3843_08G140600 [Carya illinoinensis]
MEFLMGLQDSYDAIRAQILLSDPLPSLNRVFSVIQQEERRRQLHYAPTLAPVAMERLYCSHCNISGHSLERCFKANPNLPVCSHCRIAGHTKDKCYWLNGYPSGHKNGPKSKYIANIVSLEQEQNHNGSPITQEQYSKLLVLLQPSSSSTIDNTPAVVNQAQLLHSPTMSGNSSCFLTHNSTSTSSPRWILDIGTTDHMVCSPNFFTHNITRVSHSVKLPNGTTTIATHLGDIHFSPHLIFKHVLCSSIFL